MSPQQVGNLTYNEFNIFMKSYNEKKKNEYEMQRNVILNAINNAFRKNGTDIIPLFSDVEEKSIEKIIEEREELFGRI